MFAPIVFPSESDPLLPVLPADSKLAALLEGFNIRSLGDAALRAQMPQLTAKEDLPVVRQYLVSKNSVPSDFPGLECGRYDNRMNVLNELCSYYQRSFSAPNPPEEGTEAFSGCLDFVRALRKDRTVVERVGDFEMIKRLKLIYELAQTILGSSPDVGWCVFFGGFLRGRRCTKDIDLMTFSRGDRLQKICVLPSEEYVYRDTKASRMYESLVDAINKFSRSNADYIAIKSDMEELMRFHPQLYPVKPRNGEPLGDWPEFTIQLSAHPFFPDLCNTDIIHHGALVFIRGEHSPEGKESPMRVIFDSWADPMDCEYSNSDINGRAKRLGFFV